MPLTDKAIALLDDEGRRHLAQVRPRLDAAGEWMADEWAAHAPGRGPASRRWRIGGARVVPGATILLDLIGYVPGG